MAVHSLFPSFVQIFYHSVWAPHVMTIPTLQWNPGADQGTFDTWEAGTTGADGMINSFIDDWADLFTTAVTFDYYTIFNYADEDALPVPVAFGALGTTGTQTPGSLNDKAVQITVSWQCSDGSILKTVGMDAVAPVDFVKAGPLDLASFIPDIIAEITGVANGWASRAGGQPLFGKQAAFTLNEKLRRNYHEN